MPFPATTPADVRLELERLVGERTVPQLWHENYWFRRHEIAYLALAPLVAAQLPGSAGVLLEAGSGEGYGVRLLRRAGADRVAALDYDAGSLTHARAAYPDDLTGRGIRTNLAALPLATASAGAITCFQVIEHLWTPGQFLAECARVLRPGGLLVITTPNRLTFSPGVGRGEQPPNPYHFREFDAAELRDLVGEQFPITELLGVRHGPRLQAWQQEHGDPIAAQLATSPDRWPVPVSDLVRSISADDFELGPVSPDDKRVLDLVVLARAEGQ